MRKLSTVKFWTKILVMNPKLLATSSYLNLHFRCFSRLAGELSSWAERHKVIQKEYLKSKAKAQQPKRPKTRKVPKPPLLKDLLDPKDGSGVYVHQNLWPTVQGPQRLDTIFGLFRKIFGFSSPLWRHLCLWHKNTGDSENLWFVSLHSIHVPYLRSLM